MSSAVPQGAGVVARDATPADNAGLLALTAACPMVGDVGLCVNRAPDFFALNRLEGERWQVGVVDAPQGAPIGCIALAERTAYVHGRPTKAAYVSDLKVHPAHRGSGAADALILYARDTLREWLGTEVPTLLTVLAGNRSMERRLGGPRGLPQLDRFATIRSHSIVLLGARRLPRGDLRVRRAVAGDLEEMAALWQQVAAGRQFAPVLDAAALAYWIDSAPALDLSHYLLAHTRDGKLAGFLALWDQDSFKQLRVTGYSRRLAVVRGAFNLLAPVFGATRLPAPGAPMRHATVVHACVPANAPQVLRTLLVHAYQSLRGSGYSFFSIGLDVTDPLAPALEGLFAQPTDIWACVTTPAGRYSGPALNDRPVHHEIALV